MAGLNRLMTQCLTAFGFFSWIVLFAVSTGSGAMAQSCNLTVDEWSRIKNFTSVRNFVQLFIDNGDCNLANPDGLLGKYRNCASTLDQIVSSQGLEPGSSCVSAISASLQKTGNPYQSGDISDLATRICTAKSFGNTMTDNDAVGGYFCLPVEVFGCPQGADILRFATFAGCHLGVFGNKSKDFIDDYFATRKDIQCMRDHDICKVFAEWTTCPITVNQTLTYLSVDRAYTCDNMFPFHPERCLITFQQQQELYCPPLTVLEANLYTIAITCSVGPVAIIACFFLYRRIYRSEHISDDDMLKEAIAPTITVGMDSSSSPAVGSPRKTVHPELQYVLKKSKYKGVKFDPATGSWYVEGMQRMFINEKEAAQQAYLQNAEYHGPPSFKVPSQTQILEFPPGLSSANPGYEYHVEDVEAQEEPVSPVEQPEEMLARRKAQLTAFYSYWDPEKPDIEDHVDHLFQRHDFRYIMRAVKTKYGVVPPGWEDEVEREDNRF